MGEEGRRPALRDKVSTARAPGQARGYVTPPRQAVKQKLDKMSRRPAPSRPPALPSRAGHLMLDQPDRIAAGQFLAQTSDTRLGLIDRREAQERAIGLFQS